MTENLAFLLINIHQVPFHINVYKQITRDIAMFVFITRMNKCETLYSFKIR